MNTIKALSIFIISLLLVMGCASKDDKPDMSKAPSGTIHIENWNIQAVATMNVGQGELKFNNRVYKFEIGGVGAGGVGVTKISASGQVHNLKKIADFSGKYFEVKVSGTVGVGKEALAMENDKGVVIKLVSDSKGLQLTAGPEGITIKMK
ncbi:MAG: hypothetical protein QNJ02_03265 [Desulfobacterales bacterium]|nr:hypothetical protein [Desulfobacterales bacterium]MDJ0874262.1 hypothetical protein [Desulfobacterales bacterium]